MAWTTAGRLLVRVWRVVTSSARFWASVVRPSEIVWRCVRRSLVLVSRSAMFDASRAIWARALPASACAMTRAASSWPASVRTRTSPGATRVPSATAQLTSKGADWGTGFGVGGTAEKPAFAFGATAPMRGVATVSRSSSTVPVTVIVPAVEALQPPVIATTSARLTTRTTLRRR